MAPMIFNNFTRGLEDVKSKFDILNVIVKFNADHILGSSNNFQMPIKSIYRKYFHRAIPITQYISRCKNLGAVRK